MCPNLNSVTFSCITTEQPTKTQIKRYIFHNSQVADRGDDIGLLFKVGNHYQVVVRIYYIKIDGEAIC